VDVHVHVVGEPVQLDVLEAVAGSLHGFGQEPSFTEGVDILAIPVFSCAALFFVAAGLFFVNRREVDEELQNFAPVDVGVRLEGAVWVSHYQAEFDGTVAHGASERVVHHVEEL